MSIKCFVTGLPFLVVVVVVVFIMAPISARRSDRREAFEYMVRSIQKNVGVAFTSTPTRSPISKRATSSVVPPLLITASWRAFMTPRPYL